MANVDERIVNMQFNNAQFQRGIAQTSLALEQLNNHLKLAQGASGIDNAQRAADRFSMQNMENQVTSINNKFGAFGAVAFSVINNLTNRVVDAGLAMGAALIDPIVNGGARRAEAIQKAQFQFRGLGLDIEATMKAARDSVLGTAFSLDQAATAAGQLGASGITAGAGLEQALRGIAGLAAQSGSSFDQVAQVFQKIAGNGRLMGTELLQLSSYGINAAATIAKSMGITEAAVREMVSEGKISFQEFSDAMANTFGDNAKKANELFTGALANMNAALARIGAEFQGPKLNNLRDIFNALSPQIDNVKVALMPLIDAFNEIQNSQAARVVSAITDGLGPSVVTSIRNIVDAILALYGATSRAFIRIFPDNTEAQFAAISDFLEKFTAALIPSTRAAGQLSRTFAGLFAIFSILGQIIGMVINTIFDLIGVAAPAGDSFLSITARIGDFLVRVDTLLKQGEFLQTFFATLGDFIEIPLALLVAFFGIIADGVRAIQLFGGSGAALDQFSADVEKRFSGLIDLSNFLVSAMRAVAGVVVGVYNFLLPVFIGIGNAVRDAIEFVKGMLAGLSFDESIQTINTGIFAAFLLVVRGFFGNLGGVIAGNGVAIVQQFKTVMTTLRVNLKALEINTNAKTLVQIAIAVALLAASAIALSMVDSVKLASALGAIAGMLGGLIGAFAAFSKIGGMTGIFQALALSTALTGMATAILILSAAVAILGNMPLANLVQGTVAVQVILASLTGTMLLLGKSAPQVLAAAVAIGIIAPAIVILTGAVAILGAIPLPNLIQGMAGFVVMLAALSGALALMSLVGPKVILSAAAIALVAPAIAVLAGAVAIMAALPLANLIQGIAGFVVILAALAGGILLLGLAGPSVLLGAIAITAVSLAMVPLVGAIAALGALPFENLIQGMVAFTVALAILVGAVLLLGFTGPVALIGAAAIVAIALAIAVLAPALVLLSTISWDGIGRLLTVLSAGLGILVVMGILLIPASVGFLMLGTAIILIGTGVMFAATGIGLLATGLGLLIGVGAAGVGVLMAGFAAFIAMLPTLAVGVAGFIVGVAVNIAAQGSTLVGAFVSIILTMLGAVNQLVPEIVNTAVIIITALVEALVVLVPMIVEAALTILVALLTSIRDHIDDVAQLAVEIIGKFLEGIGRGMPTLVQGAFDLIIDFIDALAEGIEDNIKDINKATTKLVLAIADGVAYSIKNNASTLRKAGEKIGAALLEGAKKILGIASPSKEFAMVAYWAVVGLTRRLTTLGSSVERSGAEVGGRALTGVQRAMAEIGDAINEDLDIQPTIRPVVDLDGIRNASRDISGLIKSPTLSLDTSSDVAQSVSLQEQQRNAQLVIDATRAEEKSKGDVYFTQNNNSPKALSTVEIYRKTQGQLATLKGDLGVVDQSGSS